MTKTVKEMLEAAHSAVKKITVAEAKSMISNDDALLIDVRDAPEIEQSGKITGALHISRGMLEFRADPATPYHNAALRKDRPVILYCASGGRAALAGRALQEMGYEKVYNLGAFKDWVEAGGGIENPTA